MKTARAAYEVIKAGVAMLTEEKDKVEFGKSVDIYETASGMVAGNEENEALLKGWAVAEANRIVYLLWRRNILTEELEKEYRALPTTEEAMADYNKIQAANKEVADAIEAQRKEYMDGRHACDIFRGVIGGMTKEKAEEEYKRFQEQLAQSMNAQR